MKQYVIQWWDFLFTKMDSPSLVILLVYVIVAMTLFTTGQRHYYLPMRRFCTLYSGLLWLWGGVISYLAMSIYRLDWLTILVYYMLISFGIGLVFVPAIVYVYIQRNKSN